MSSFLANITIIANDTFFCRDSCFFCSAEVARNIEVNGLGALMLRVAPIEGGGG